MKILVSGGAGFIGSHIVDAFVNDGHRVAVVDNLSSGKMEFVNKKAEFYKADITNRKAVSAVFAVEKPDVLCHQAAQISVRESVNDPVNDAQINIIGLLNLLEEGRKNKLGKVIFASSGGVVYGDAALIPTPEDYEPKVPLSPYGVAKLASEHYLNIYLNTYGIKYVALRYSNVYGPRQNPHGEAGVVAIFSKKLLKGEAPVINGDGRQTRDYIYVGDVARANFQALKSKYTGPVNIGTGIETDVNGIFRGIRGVLDNGPKAINGPAKAGEQKRSCLNISHAQKVLSWSPRIKLQQGLKETVEFFRSQ